MTLEINNPNIREIVSGNPMAKKQTNGHTNFRT